MTLIRSAVFNLYFVLATLGYGVVGLFVRAFAPQRALWHCIDGRTEERTGDSASSSLRIVVCRVFVFSKSAPN